MLPGDVGMGEGPLLCTGVGRWVSRLPREASAAGHSWAPPLQGTLSLKGPGRAGLGPPAPARGLLGKRLAAHTASASGAVAWCLWGSGFYKRLCHQERGTTVARAASSLLWPRGSLLTSFKKHRRRPRLPSSFGSVPHTRVLCLVVLLGAVLRGRHDCYPPSILRSSVGTSRGHRGRTRHRWAWTRRWLRGLPCGRRTGPRRWLRLTSAEGLGRPGACGYPRCLLADGVRLPHCWRQGWEREGEGRG